MTSAFEHQISRRRLFVRLGQAGLVTASVTAGSSLLAACSGGSGGSGTAVANSVGGVGGATSAAQIPAIGWSLNAGADSLDIAKSFTSQTGVLSSLGYDTLVILDHKLQIAPWIATMKVASPTSYVFDLRPDVKFWDGTPLTPEDVAYSYTRHLDKSLSSLIGSLMTTVKTVKVTGPEQVTVTLSSPDPTFKYTASIVQIFNAAQVKKAGSAFGSPTAVPIGTGQYVLTDYTTGGGLTGTINPHYWGEKPKVEKITVSVVANSETARVAVQQGSSDGRFDIPNAQLSKWDKTAGVDGGRAPGLSPLLLRFPTKTAPFDDVNVRQAIAYCVDRAGIVKSLLGGAGEPAVGIPTRGHWLGVMNNTEVDAYLKSLPSYSFSLDKAKAALAKSKVPDGFSANLYVGVDRDLEAKTATAIASTLQKIGINLNIKVISINSLQQNYLIAPAKKQGLVISTTSPTYPDPTDMLTPFLSSDATSGWLNAGKFANADVDNLLRKQLSATGTKRVDMLKQIGLLALEQLPYVPIAWIDATVALRSEFHLQEFDAFSYYRPWAHNIGASA